MEAFVRAFIKEQQQAATTGGPADNPREAEDKKDTVSSEIAAVAQGEAKQQSDTFVSQLSDAESTGNVRVVSADGDALTVNIEPSGESEFRATGLQELSMNTEVRDSPQDPWKPVQAYAQYTYTMILVHSPSGWKVDKYDFVTTPEYSKPF